MADIVNRKLFSSPYRNLYEESKAILLKRAFDKLSEEVDTYIRIRVRFNVYYLMRDNIIDYINGKEG